MKHSSAFSISAAACLTLLSLASTHAFASAYSEIGDAGSLPGTAQVAYAPAGPSAPLTSINGTLTLSNGLSEPDMFEIYISSPLTFSATTTGFIPGVNNFDSQLFLFTLGGIGVMANDDDPNSNGGQSTLGAFTLQSGLYYLLITGSGLDPVSAGGLIFPNYTDGVTDPTGLYGPTGVGGALPIVAYTGNSSEGGRYSIALTGANFVPEPSTILTAGLGLGLAALLRRRR